MKNIFLIGYRCTGKSTIGRALAQRLDRPFVDIDDAVVDAQGDSIARMVADHGWAYFRAKEREALVRACGEQDQIVATGGGVILDPENIRDMKASGIVVWLRARPETIMQWLANDEKTADFRPALTTQGAGGEVVETLKVRTPFYKAAADLFIHTDGFDVAALCAKIVEALARRDASLIEKGRE